ncbi:Uncharacterised protein [Mycobacterium tuberculosis]|uniref:Uncharacterized protein n=1 Tax=Mycobacterium tuberculosis TaxID=1773 RepID=A0A916L864_MYCTX|nr:Uncharacterised protein [Mycobacterium tuberculosis]
MASWYCRVSPCWAALAWDRCSSSGVRSVEMTVAPVLAAGSEILPEPAATSSTRTPGPMPAAATRIGPSGAITSSAIRA